MSLKSKIENYDINYRDYLKCVKHQLTKNNLDPKKLKIANDGKHKFIYDGVKFGSIINKDYLIYSLLEYEGLVDKGTAEMKRKAYRARAKDIYEKADYLSPSYLSFNILW